MHALRVQIITDPPGAGDSGKGGKKINSKRAEQSGGWSSKKDTARGATKGKGHGFDINVWDEGGMNNKGRVPRAGSSDTLQQELFSAAGDEGTLKALVNQIYESRSPLNVINISTILHRMARKRIFLPAGVTDFLASRLEGMDRQGKIESTAGRPGPLPSICMINKGCNSTTGVLQR